MLQVSPERDQQFRRMRDVAREIFSAALKNASIESAFSRHLRCERGVLRICEDLYDLNSYNRVLVVSIGKAAHTMAAALEAQVGSRLEGIVASSAGPAGLDSVSRDSANPNSASQNSASLNSANPNSVSRASTGQVRGFRYFFGGHPTPTAESIHAAEAILKSLGSLDANSLAIFLLSGGGSSIVEKPIEAEISLADLVATYRALVHSGAPIAAINAIRKHLSAVKGGRLAQAAYPAQQVSILVSDVPDSTPDALASGPTMPDSTSIYDCERIAAEYNLVVQFPPSVADLFRQRPSLLEETPKSDDPAFVRARWWTVLSNKVALEEAAAAAAHAGFAVEIDNSCDDWDYEKAADYLLRRLREFRSKAPRVCLLSGGEVTVTVRNGGVGGRNQQFALACAEKISGDDITVLSAGTDGIDGNSPAAGAVADGSTLLRTGNNEGDRDGGLAANHPSTLNHSSQPKPGCLGAPIPGALGTPGARQSLAAFNGFPFFEALGDAILIGPTGNNLRDLRILLAY